MTLSTGTKLAHYEITSQLGKGGMGEVYQAKDQKLGRDVAIKVLPEEFARDVDRVARFQREAKLLASLNHPNIAAIYGLEEAEDTSFLVLELIEGETLADRLKRGPIPVEEALKLALQIVEALEAAHEKGVIHRDLKPANIKVTPNGKVKVLDFGLAKAFTGDQGEVNLADSPTLTVAATQQGVILGTAAYMSPEQARGEPVDQKADIWAFGVVLFEMLTGRQVFTGRTVSDTLASVLAREPEWNGLPPNLHSRIRFLLERCLKKEAKDRYSGISDARVEIQEVLADPGGVLVQPSATAKPRKILPWITLTAVLSVIVAGIAVWYLKSVAESKSVSKVSITLPPNQQLQRLDISMLAFSPDGTKLAYVSFQEGTAQIYLRSIDNFKAMPIAGTEGSGSPVFSPDGQWLAFTDSMGSRLMKVPIQGGAPASIADISFTRGLSWGENDTITLAPIFGLGGLFQVLEGKGNPNPVTHHDSESLSHRWPQLLPGREALIFTAWNRNAEKDRIMLYSLKTGEQKILIKGGTDGRYVPTGHLVYANQGNLFAVPFNLERLEVEGEAVPILEGVMQSTEGIAQYSFSSQGSLAYIPGSIGTVPDGKPIWLDRSGKEQSLEIPPGSYSDLTLSPSEKQIALTAYRTNDEIWIYDILNPNFTRLVLQGRNNIPIWTFDGKQITFRSDQGGTGFLDLFWMPIDGSRGPECLVASEYDDAPNSWSPDGKFLIFTRWHPTNSADLWILPLESEQEPQALLQTEYTEMQGKFSPDGRWIAYMSNATGRNEIYVLPFPGPGRAQQVSTNGGAWPVWGQRTAELFYVNENRIIAVDVETSPTFKVVRSKPLHEKTYGLRFGFDVTPDGNRFLVLKTIEQEQAFSKINIVLNWFEELKEKVPVE